MPNPWTYDAKQHRYISPTGKVLNQQATVQLRNRFAAAQKEIARSLAGQFSSGAINRIEFAAQFARFISDTMTASYLAGRGGMNAALKSDMLKMQEIISNQFGFAADFTLAIQRDELSADQIAERAGLYADTAVKAFEEGKAFSHGFELPGYPADWETECKAGCRCYWEIEETETEYRATWHAVSDDRTCEDCLRREREWSPWVVPK